MQWAELMVFGALVGFALPVILARAERTRPRRRRVGGRSPARQLVVAVVPGVLGALLVLVPRADLVDDETEPWLLAAAVAVVVAVAVAVVLRRRRPGADQPEVIDLRDAPLSVTREARHS